MALIAYIDVGAAGRVEAGWRQRADDIRYVGFDPDRRSATDFQHRKIFSNASGF